MKWNTRLSSHDRYRLLVQELRPLFPCPEQLAETADHYAQEFSLHSDRLFLKKVSATVVQIRNRHVFLELPVASNDDEFMPTPPDTPSRMGIPLIPRVLRRAAAKPLRYALAS